MARGNFGERLKRERELREVTPNEIVVAISVTTGGRPLPRVGGLQKHEVTGTDGLR